MATARYVINGNSASYSFIIKYIPKISKVETTLFGPSKLLIALKDISNAKSNYILRILVIRIE